MRPARKVPDAISATEFDAQMDALGVRRISVPLDPYDKALIEELERLVSDRCKPLVKIFFAGEKIAEIYDTRHGALWTSVYEIITARNIHPDDEHFVSMIVADRSRWDRVGKDGMPRTLRAAIELVEWPDPIEPPRLKAMGPSGGRHEFDLADVIREIKLARGNRPRSRRWDVDKRPEATRSTRPTAEVPI